jgi:hypothetical protein
MTDRQPLAQLEGRPIYEGTRLYDRDGVLVEARKSIHKDYPMNMLILNVGYSTRQRWWATDTHWNGQQVLFWEKPIKYRPSPKWPWA